MQILKDIVYGTEAPESQILDLYLPDKDTTDLFIYFHGGGLEHGDKCKGGEIMPFILPLVEEHGKAVISANYRMYPNAVFPDFLEDAAKVVAWAKENIGTYKSVTRIFVGGSSAGAWLTAMLAYAPAYLGKYDIKTTDITGYIVDSAQMTTHLNILRERGLHNKQIRVDEAAPVYYLEPDMVFPNALFIVADNDMPCRYEQNLMFLKTLEIFGCPQEKMQFKYMEGYKHCRYVNDGTVFTDIVNAYIDSVQ